MKRRNEKEAGANAHARKIRDCVMQSFRNTEHCGMWPRRIDNGPVVRLGWLGYELVQRDRLPVMMCVCYSTELYCILLPGLNSKVYRGPCFIDFAYYGMKDCISSFCTCTQLLSQIISASATYERVCAHLDWL